MKTRAVVAGLTLAGFFLAGCTSEPAAERVRGAETAGAPPEVPSAGEASEPELAIPNTPRREGPINGRYLAWAPQWGEHNVYLRRMVHVVQFQWERVLAGSAIAPPPGTSVTVRFVLNSEGRIARILDVTGNASDEAAEACVRGLVNRAPYHAWTPAMKADLGNEAEVALTFQYQ